MCGGAILGPDKNWGSISRTTLGEVDDLPARNVADAKIGDFSSIVSKERNDGRGIVNWRGGCKEIVENLLQVTRSRRSNGFEGPTYVGILWW